jgi:hydrogenase-1 operon protein HyaF
MSMHTVIPIHSLMPTPDEALDVMPMPHEMSTFVMPQLPEAGSDADLAGAQAVLQDFVAQMALWLHEGASAPALELQGLPAAVLRVINESLGEGEVSAIVDDDVALRIQETVFCGVWRQQHLAPDGSVLRDILLGAPVPPLLPALARERGAPRLRTLALPAGAMNVQPLLHELQEAMDRSEAGAGAHVINLTLLPLSPADRTHLDALLEGGGVVLLSRSFGHCRISSTAARHVWRVQYFNNMQTLILNTLEVSALPEVAQAAHEDLLESHTRLAELVQWMRESGGVHD